MIVRSCAVTAIACALVGSVHADPIAAPVRPVPMLTDDQLLALAALQPGEVIVLEGTAPVEPATASERVLDERTLATTPRRSAEDVLRAVPGLYLSSHGAEGKAQQFFLRRFDAVHGSDLEVRVAGLGINEPSNVHGHGYVDLGFVIPEVLQSVRAREGSFAIDQGDFATAGSVALELGTSTRGARLGYEVGTTARHRVLGVYAPTDGPTEELIAVEAMRDDGFGENRGSERVSAVAQTRIAVAGGWVQPVAFAYAARFGEPGVLPLADYQGERTAFDAAYSDGEGASQRALVGVRAGRGAVAAGVWLGWRGLRLDENFTGYLLSPAHGDARVQHHTATSGGAELAVRRPVTTALAVVAGVDGRVDVLGQREDQVDDDGEVWLAGRRLRARTLGGAARLGVELRRGGLRVDAGVRADVLHVRADDQLNDRRGRGTVGALSPRVTVAWERGKVGLFAAYGRGVRSPEARAFVTDDGGADTDHSLYTGGAATMTRSDAAEVGVRVSTARVAVSLSGFATLIDRESQFDHVSGTNLELDGTRRLGGELAVTAKPRSWLELRADVTAVDARFDVTGNPVPGAPRLLAQGEAHLSHGPWRGGVHAVYVGARPLAHGATGAATAVVDALVGWQRGALELGLQLDNVLGQRWFEGEYHFASRWDRNGPAAPLPKIHYSAGRPFGARLSLTYHL